MSIGKKLSVEKIVAGRDTKMVDIHFGKDHHKYYPIWEGMITEGEKTDDPYLKTRCWLVSATLVNHYYGGNITQDEIEYNVRYDDEHPLTTPFKLRGGSYGSAGTEVRDAFRFALQKDDIELIDGTPSYKVVKNAIDKGNLVFAGVKGHAMIVYGYVGDESSYALYYAFIDNQGIFGNSAFYTEKIIEYYVFDGIKYGSVAMSDPRVFLDSDGDGLCDFDEEERFCSYENGTKRCLNSHSIDSDNDAIEDKREVYNYMNETELIIQTGDKEYTYSLEEIQEPNFNVKMESLFKLNADRDRNGIYAELDPKEDGTSGKVHSALTTMTKEKHCLEVSDVPGQYTLFAQEWLKINDKVHCYNTSDKSDNYCQVGSAGDRKYDYFCLLRNELESNELCLSKESPFYAIEIGAYAHVGYVVARQPLDMGALNPKYDDLKKFVKIRNCSTFHGALQLIVKDLGFDANAMSADEIKDVYTHTQACYDGGKPVEYRINGTPYNPETINNGQLAYIFALPDISSIARTSEKIISNGITYHLKDGDAFKFLKVESGGTLYIEPGTMYVDKIQVDAGARIEFTKPGYETVLNVDGEVIWHVYVSKNIRDERDYWLNVARGFKMIQHSSVSMNLQGTWAGTLYAPLSPIILGQIDKVIFGRVLGRNITVHQTSKVFRVDFDPIPANSASQATVALVN